MTTTQRIKHADVEGVILAHCKSLQKIDKSRANAEEISDDFEHISTKTIVESKRSATTVNQVHPVKADVVIVSKSDNEHIAVTMGELFPLISKQHAIHKWECANVSSKKVYDKYGPWVSNDNLEDAVEYAVARSLEDTNFKDRQSQARQTMKQLYAQFESI